MAGHDRLRVTSRRVAARSGVAALIIGAIVLTLVLVQFQGGFDKKAYLTMIAARAGLVMEPGSPVTFNGVQIGTVHSITAAEHNGQPAAKFVLAVKPKYLKLIPNNVDAEINATTVFGNKYVSLLPNKAGKPSGGPIRPNTVIDVSGVTTEFNTLFQTLTEISERVDPVKLNLTLSAVAQALDGLGDKFGTSIVNANAILDDVNPQLPRIRHNIQALAALGDTYSKAAPDLMEFLNNSVTTARTLRGQQKDLDATLLAAAGLGNTGADIFERGGPYLQRALADGVSTNELLDEYSPEFTCMLRGWAGAAKLSSGVLGGNGYSLDNVGELVGAGNAYIYPENLPRGTVRGGPGGAPGCWQEITRDFWPTPWLVVDDGVSIAPYNHFEVGSPWLIDYVWGRQVGDNTINP